MEIYVHLYLAELLLESEIFQTNVVEKTKTHILCPVTFPPRKSCSLGDNVEKYGRPRQTTGGNILRPKRFACCIIKATDIHA
jgi:hypothetical protein